MLAAVGDPRPAINADEPCARLDADFLRSVGWDPATETLAPRLDHPLLGFRPCLVRGCGCEALPDGLCATCSKAHRGSGASWEEFIAAGPVRKKRNGEVICAVPGCERPA